MTCSAATPAAPAAGSATCWAASSAAVRPTTQQATRPRRGADIETEATLSFGDAIDGVDRVAAAGRRGGVQGVHGHRRQGRHRPAGLPDLRGHRRGQPEPGQLRVLRALQDLQGPGPDRGRPVRGVLGQRAGHEHADDPGADPGGRRGRPADQAQGQGRARRARRPGRRPVRAGARRQAPGVRPVGAQPDHHRPGDVRRGDAGRRDQGPVAPAGCRSASASRPGPRTAAPSGSAARASGARTPRSATCSSRSTSRSRAT